MSQSQLKKKSQKVLGINNALSAINDKPGGLVQLVARQLFFSRIYNAVITVLFAVVLMVLVLKPTPVMVVDESGNPIGQYEWFDSQSRSEIEVLASSKRFVQSYISLNSATIFEDAAIALNAMCDPLQDETKKEWKDKGYLARVYNAGAVSRVSFDDEKSTIELDRGRGVLRLVGTLYVGVKQPQASPFDIALELIVVPRHPSNTLGVEVCAIS